MILDVRYGPALSFLFTRFLIRWGEPNEKSNLNVEIFIQISNVFVRQVTSHTRAGREHELNFFPLEIYQETPWWSVFGQANNSRRQKNCSVSLLVAFRSPFHNGVALLITMKFTCSKITIFELLLHWQVLEPKLPWAAVTGQIVRLIKTHNNDMSQSRRLYFLLQVREYSWKSVSLAHVCMINNSRDLLPRMRYWSGMAA